MTISEQVFDDFLNAQFREVLALTAQSDILSVQPMPIGDGPPQNYLASFQCRTVTCAKNGAPRTEEVVAVFAITFPDDYLRRAAPMQIVTLLDPPQLFSPHIRFPAICCGRLTPGTGLVDILYQIWEVMIWMNVAPQDALNPQAAQWARNNLSEFPTDPRPLKRKLSTPHT